MGFFLKQKSMFLVYQEVFSTPVHSYNTSKNSERKNRNAFFPRSYTDLPGAGNLSFNKKTKFENRKVTGDDFVQVGDL